jgi:serralysin
MRNKNVVRLGLGFMVSALCACGAGADVEPLSFEQEEELAWQEFRASAIFEPEINGYIVDGDITLSDEQELREYWEDTRSRLTQGLTVMRSNNVDVIWNSTARHNLTYCVSNNFGTRKAQVVNEMATATASWSARLGVTFKYVSAQDANCTSSNTNVVFDVSPSSSTSYFASAFFPNDTRSARRLLITSSAFTTTSGGRDFQGILRHELGHALGFRHEHIWTGCTTESTSNARLLTSTYDESSVMFYPQCRSSGTGGYRQTEKDFVAGATLYPK